MPRSQTSSPHFGSLAINYHRAVGVCGGTSVDSRAQLYGSGTSQAASSEHISGAHHDIRGPSPIQAFLGGPLPSPGHLLGLKTPLYRGSRSPLNLPLFPLSKRRWSEAAAGEIKGEQSMLDAESHMRRWSMPWLSNTVKNTVSWHQTRIMPISKLAVPSKSGSDRSQNMTSDSNWHSSATSQDGLAEAIQLLSCRPTRIYQPQPQPFIEEPIAPINLASSFLSNMVMLFLKPPTIPAYIKFNRDRDDAV